VKNNVFTVLLQSTQRDAYKLQVLPVSNLTWNNVFS